MFDVLWIAAAWADAPVPEVVPPAPEVGALVPASSSALIDEGWRRIDRADYVGARIVADEVIARGDDQQVSGLMLLGAADELERKPREAIPRYEAALALVDPDAPAADHLHFRLAESLASAGDGRAAAKILAKLRKEPERTPDDLAKIDLVLGIVDVDRGKEARGEVRLGQVLGTESEDLSFYRAKAHASLAHLEVTRANRASLAVSDNKQAEAIRTRATHLAAAEAHVLAAIALEEPEWTLDGIGALGGGYEQLADDLDACPAPKKLTDAQAELFHSALHDKAMVLWTKAYAHYDEGVRFAERLGWQSPRVADLEAARARAKDKAD